MIEIQYNIVLSAVYRLILCFFVGVWGKKTSGQNLFRSSALMLFQRNLRCAEEGCAPQIQWIRFRSLPYRSTCSLHR